MNHNPTHSRSSSQYSKSVAFPHIKTDQASQSYNKLDSNGGRIRTGSTMQSSPEEGKMLERTAKSDFNQYVLERLEFTEKSLENERHERFLLEDKVAGLLTHIQRLNKEMANLQHQLRSGETNAQSQLKNVELQQVSSTGDMWNRLTLADLSIIKISGDCNKLSGETSDLKKSLEDLGKKVEKRQSDMENMTAKLQRMDLKMEKDSLTLKSEFESQLNKLQRQVNSPEQCNVWNTRTATDIEQEVKHSSAALKKIEQDLFMWKESTEKSILTMGNDVSKLEVLTRKIEDLAKYLQNAMGKSHQKMKGSYREAFRAVYESITTMQTVLETKLRMTETDLKTSINSILRSLSNRN